MRISVVIPCHDRRDYIGHAVRSAALQSRSPHEILVVDDGSTDGSADVARAEGAVVVTLGENRGQAAARNIGVDRAAGDWIAFLDSDDVWLPEHLETVARLVERHPEVAAAFSGVELFGDRSGEFRGAIPLDRPVRALSEAFWDWLHIPSASLLDRSAVREVGGFDESISCAVDFDFWIRLARVHPVIASGDITVRWRWHPGQISSNPWESPHQTYRSRRRFVDDLRGEGEVALADELDREFLRRWIFDVRSAWDRRDFETLRFYHSLRRYPRRVPWKVRAEWQLRTRIPERTIRLLDRLRR